MTFKLRWLMLRVSYARWRKGDKTIARMIVREALARGKR
jgi:hypothetical protein